jgi:hypothetical protein
MAMLSITARAERATVSGRVREGMIMIIGIIAVAAALTSPVECAGFLHACSN